MEDKTCPPGESLQEARDRFHSVVDYLVHAIIMMDDGGIIESINPAAKKLFGYQADELIGQSIKVILPETCHKEHDAYLASSLNAGAANTSGVGRELLGRCKDGSTFPIDVAVSTFCPRGRRFITEIIRDMTQRKRLEQELQSRTNQLIEADQRKNEFLAMLGHELRNPLAPIHNALQLLRENCPSDAEAQWAYGVIERQVQHMTRMVDDLIDISRISRGNINLYKQPIEISAVITRAVDMAQPLIVARKQKLSVSFAAEPIWVDADPSRLAQILTTLLNNAATYTKEGGGIWLTMEILDNEAVIKVRDTGIGMPADYLPRIFDMCAHGDRSLERNQDGLGTGLPLVRQLVELHGGSIQAYSAGPGQGSEFVVRLPTLITVPPGQASQPSAQQSAGKCPQPRRILVVDDNVDGARSLTIWLKSAGHEVKTVYDGPTALATARDWVPQVVLLDIGLPGMNGLEVARRMRSEFDMVGTLIVAMTGYGQDEDRHRSQEAGFNAHLIKPLDLDALQILLARQEDVAGSEAKNKLCQS